ncbi:MAG: STAS domain-containing protein [Ilumatobacteraceae bacterium]
MIDDVLRVDVSFLDGRVLIAPNGDIDADSVLALQAVLDEFNLERHMVIDMTRVRFIDSSGLNVLIRESLRLSGMHGSLYIRNPSPSVRRVVDTTGLAEFFYEPAP